MTETFTERIDAAMEMCEKATKGPWRYCGCNKCGQVWSDVTDDGKYVADFRPHHLWEDAHDPLPVDETSANANFTANARTSLPWALRCLKRAVWVIRLLKASLKGQKLATLMVTQHSKAVMNENELLKSQLSALDERAHELASDNAQLAEDAQSYRENYERLKAELAEVKRRWAECEARWQQYAEWRDGNEEELFDCLSHDEQESKINHWLSQHEEEMKNDNRASDR